MPCRRQCHPSSSMPIVRKEHELGFSVGEAPICHGQATRSTFTFSRVTLRIAEFFLVLESSMWVTLSL